MRERHLQEVLDLVRPISEIGSDLAAFPWDCDAPLVKLDQSHIASVLTRFLSCQLSASEVEEWADAIECRDDIGLDPDSAAGIALNELANPLLTEPLTRQSAARWVAVLGGSTA